MRNNYTCIHVSENIYLAKEEFGDFNKEVICDLLKHIDIWMSDAIGREHIPSKKVFIIHRDDYPMCSDVNPYRIIFLATEGDYWCQWVYQFVHEYCHHIIDGPMDGEMGGLKWFEETVCALSSMYCLYQMIDYCAKSPSPILRHQLPSVLDHLGALLKTQTETVPLHSYIEAHLHLLSQSDYHRKIYNHIAGAMLPLFLQCSSLWQIMLHFGNMREWQSLSQLIDHLREEADTTYSDSLEKLRSLLLGPS